jgi:hypothetical protein
MESTYLGKAILPFRSVCKRFRDASPIAFEAYKNKLFVDRYGARADCEKDIPLDLLIQRIESAAVNYEILGLKEPELSRYFKPKINLHSPMPHWELWLEIDSSQVPRLVNREASIFKKETSLYARLRTKYRFYRREFHRERDEKIKNILRLRNNIAEEFHTRLFNALHPLQDLRDRRRRVETLKAERGSLFSAWKETCGSYDDFLTKLSSIEKVFFSIISWFHSWFQKPYMDEYRVPEQSEIFESFDNKEIKLGETKIIFQGQKIPIDIKVRFYWSATTAFSIYRQDNQSKLGHLILERKWLQKRPNCRLDREFSELDANDEQDIETLSYPKLSIVDIHNPELQQDSTNGDRPIMRLFTQIAVEIFQLEANRTLEIRSNPRDADVYVAGGFAMLNPGLSENRIKHALQKARQENQLFPAIVEHGAFEFSVYLGKSSTNARTQFVTTNEKGQEQPAMVDFDFDHPPITWEEQIAKNRLLPEKGPILPKFFIHDLSRFEKPTQSA